MRKKAGFTLAEALLTLALIGMVAAIILPFLYDSVRNKKLATSFKNIYAETHSALTNIALNEDCGNSLICTSTMKGSPEQSTRQLGDKFTEFGMGSSKICGMADTGCFSHNIRSGLGAESSNTLVNTLNGVVNFNGVQPYTFISARGSSFAIFSFGLSCFTDKDQEAAIRQYRGAYTFTPVNEDVEKNPMNNICGIIVVDVNGENSPNIWGRDVFGMWITDNKKLDLQTFGNIHDNILKDNSCTAQNSLGCATKLLDAGWEMHY